MVDKFVRVETLDVNRLASLIKGQVSEDSFVAPLRHRVLHDVFLGLVELSSTLHIHNTASCGVLARTLSSLFFNLVHNILSHGSPHGLLFLSLCVSSKDSSS